MGVTRTSWLAVVTLGAGCGLVALWSLTSQTGASGFTRNAEHAEECFVGGSPTKPYDERPPEESLRYATRPVVIGCVTLASERSFELVAYQLAEGAQSSLCIDHYDFQSGWRWGCGSNLVHGGGEIDATSVVRQPARADVVSGTFTSSVRRVVVRSEIDGRLRRHAAAWVMVHDRDLLRAIAVSRPFGRYLAEIPRGARAATVEGFDARRRTRRLAFFPGFRPATGAASICYGRPRIPRARLVEAARLGTRNRVHVFVRYPRGVITSVDVTVGGGGTAHADLAPLRGGRKPGSAVVTLPVRFTRRGSVLVDVTAEGRPMSRRCGKRPPLRSSPTKTLVVRVR